MKKTLAFILFFGFGLAFSQVKETQAQPVEDHSTDHPADDKFEPYPGGMMKFRKDIADKINLTRIKDINLKTGTLFSKAKIIVKANGRIENILVTGDDPDFNKEVERAIKSLKTKLKPAERNGVPVRSSYSVPFTLTMNN
ncbi:energy transducer TonB [Chryseobacterium sp. CBSDS_008]|uniref:energy transducer TonB n=1 Tax=Chryseobacterium sp. CBSDS_008 TaxID=3415265 RepID=UPI003CFA95C3